MVILIDFENTQKFPPIEFFKPNDRVLLFVGAKQTSMKINDVFIMNSLKNMELIQVENTSQNNVDFHICYYLGCYSTNSSDGFVIISNDKGYDNLINYLLDKGLACERLSMDMFDEVEEKKQKKLKRIEVKEKKQKELISKTKEVQKEDELINKVMERFKKHPKRNRPRVEKTLTNFIKSHLPQEHRNDNTLANKIIKTMESEKTLKIENQKIKYLK